MATAPLLRCLCSAAVLAGISMTTLAAAQGPWTRIDLRGKQDMWFKPDRSKYLLKTLGGAAAEVAIGGTRLSAGNVYFFAPPGDSFNITIYDVPDWKMGTTAAYFNANSGFTAFKFESMGAKVTSSKFRQFPSVAVDVDNIGAGDKATTRAFLAIGVNSTLRGWKPTAGGTSGGASNAGGSGSSGGAQHDGEASGSHQGGGSSEPEAQPEAQPEE